MKTKFILLTIIILVICVVIGLIIGNKNDKEKHDTTITTADETEIEVNTDTKEVILDTETLPSEETAIMTETTESVEATFVTDETYNELAMSFELKYDKE